MGQNATSMGVQPFKVKKCSAMDTVAYLAPGARELTALLSGTMPPVPEGGVRVVCISDTHNEHASLCLPAGDLLVHAGDCMTESGARHVVRSKGVIKKVKPEGEFLFRSFAEWFGSQRFPYKVFVAGNHDLVVQGLGKERVQQILDESTVHGRAVYLEHEDTFIGGLRIFGSPFGHWGSHNDAFLSQHSVNYKDMPDGTHIMVTHMPAILPSEDGQGRKKDPLTSSILRAGAHLHVSGHCHWAHGLYHAQGGDGRRVPCVVASVCDSKWLGGPAAGSHLLSSAEGVRGDPSDRDYGGYNLVQPSIVCDLLLPGGRPAELMEDSEAALAAIAASRPAAAARAPTVAAAVEEDDAPSPPGPAAAADKPALLFFGPPNDPDFVDAVLPRCQELFSVDFVDSTDDGLQAVASRTYVACVAKLGTKGNLSYPILEALRQKEGDKPFVAIHSMTAAAKPQMRNQLEQELGVRHFVKPGEEDELMEVLARVAGGQAPTGRS